MPINKPMSYEEVAERIAAIENVDIQYFYTDGQPDVRKIFAARKTDLIKSFSLDKTGRVVRIELHTGNYGNIYLITSIEFFFRFLQIV